METTQATSWAIVLETYDLKNGGVKVSKKRWAVKTLDKNYIDQLNTIFLQLSTTKKDIEK